jgi:acyl-CoA synthetase (AMP-forming)/AMP-acid ligase II
MINLFCDKTTLVDRLEHYSTQKAENRAYTFLSRNKTEEINYSDLVTKSRALAASLVKRKLTDEPILLVFPSGIEFIVGFLACCYARAIPVPVNLARSSHHFKRLAGIAKDSGAKAAITTSTQIQKLQESLHEQLDKGISLDWLTVDESSGEAKLPTVTSDDIAFLQYTSGSTGNPKGVVVRHRNLTANTKAIIHTCNHEEGLVIGGWLPQFHDMGLIGHLLQVLFLGGHYVFMAPLDFIMRPIKWLQVISDYRVGSCAAPNFAYQLCVDRITEEQSAELDLSCWHVAINGSEPTKNETMDQFAKMFAPFGFKKSTFIPSYGLAEATLIVSGGGFKDSYPATPVNTNKIQFGKVEVNQISDESNRTVVGCGLPAPGHDVRIVDPISLKQCGQNEVGEIWVSGPSIADGYWRQPEKTAADFNAFIDDSNGPYLRTGDLGFLHYSQLYVTGRIKELIIINGKNYHPHDIEHTLIHASPISRKQSSAVFASDDNNREKIVAIQEVDKKLGAESIDFSTLKKQLIEKVNIEHGIVIDEIMFVRMNSLPKTSSGKIQRHLCREYLQKNKFEQYSK